ncbi:MAG: alpha/beta hydrolase family protein [Halorhabdus sp.]
MADAHRIPVADGESLAAVHHPADGERWLLFCHGFLSDKTGSYEGRCERAVAAGYDAVRFDFRGCGESDGAFVDQTLSAKLADLRSVVAHFAPGPYALFGSSFGGTVALHVAADDGRVRAVATRAPVTDPGSLVEYRALVEREGRVRLEAGKEIDERFFADLDRHDFEAVLDGLDCPVAIVHGAEDDVVAVGDSIDAVAAIDADVTLRKVPGEGHRFSRAAETSLRDTTFDWLDRVWD